MNTIENVKLPDGWTAEQNQNGSTSISAPTTETHNGGGATINWTLRKWCLGYGNLPGPQQPAYTGRNWKTKLVTDAVSGLDKALFRYPIPAPL